MKNFIAWFAGNHVAANLLMLFLMVAGAVTALKMKVEVFPEFSTDRISITTEYPGASPAEVERAIITRVEENIAGLAGVKRIDSTAREGYASVVVEVIKNWNTKELLDNIKAEVDRITTFPKEAEKPVIQEITRRSEVIDLAVYGDASEATLKEVATKLKDDITTLPGITLADLFGVRDSEIHIEISEKTLRRYGLTLGRVADLVRRGSLDLPAGSVKTPAGEILIRTKGRRYYAADYRDIAVITRPDGSTVTLGQIAKLTDGFKNVDIFARFEGKPAAVIQVYRVADQNALHVAATVKKFIEEIKGRLPAGVKIGYYNDMSKLLRSRLKLLLKNMAYGLVLVSILLGVFLNIRLAFWVTLGIPVSFLTGLWLLPHFDVSINMISLFAFIMVLGIVVDDAIVIGENIFKKREMGMAPLAASVEGTFEVGRAVVFSVFTTMVAFWPLLLGTGNMGKVLKNIPVVVILVLTGSLIESITILPAHLARSRGTSIGRTSLPEDRKRMTRWLTSVIDGPYSQFLGFCLKWRYATVATGIALLLLCLGLWRGGRIKFTFFPKVESDMMVCSLTLPAGTPVEKTVTVVDRLERSAKEVLDEFDGKRPPGAPPLYKYTVSIIGIQINVHGPHPKASQTGGHLAQVFVQLLEGEKRRVSAARLVKLWRKKTGPIPEAESVTFQSELFSAGSPIEVDLSLDNHDQLVRAADDLKKELKTYPGVFDINDSFLPGKKEMQIKLKPAARSLGLTLNDLARQVRHAFYGAEALRLQRDEDEVKVLVRFPESERKSLIDIEDMRIRAADGSEVPFDQVARVKMERGYSSIERTQRRRVIKVTADIDETVSNANEIRSDLVKNFLPQLRNDYPGLRFTIEGEGKEQKESLTDVLDGFVIALFGIYVLLAIPFKSFTQPFIVMAAIPFGIIGAIFGHMVMGHNLSILSMFGIVGLTGVVVNDSLVLIDATNRLRSDGTDAHDAVARAGAMRFRAIILTSITTFAGLTPIILERSMQAQFLIPMAVSLAFGVLFATGITLLLIPCGYLIMEDFHDLPARIKKMVFGPAQDRQLR